jgi:D-alanyl-D-alanine carboxypeptidase/D-alanyl-D-alanine-endopeptidase (penicillin-binding protein 4)
VPASNTKIVTCYAAMKYLRHILPGIKYYENDTAVYLIPTGDPTLLHHKFQNQPVIKFLQQQKKKLYITGLIFKDEALGRGWSWDDYNDSYMIERNALPVYGNTIRWMQEKVQGQDLNPQESVSVFSDPEVNWKLRFETDPDKKEFHVQRERTLNVFHVTQGQEDHAEQEVPFVVNGIQSALELLADTVGKEITISDHFMAVGPMPQEIKSQPVDSVLRPMMYESDNFFAEQLLEMVSAERTGVMSDALVIDTILKTDLAGLSKKPVWVDGSGMSRYNLFSPHIFITVLDKMKTEFGMDRIKNIFPAGDSGTLKGFYKGDTNYVYAKTGSMSGVIALSGFLYTKAGRLLEFSILVNNYMGNSMAIRRRIERFINDIR